MKLAQVRAKAREILNGKWGKVVLITLIEVAIMYGAELILDFVTLGIAGIAVMVCSIPIQYGLYMSFMKIRKNENVGYVDFLKDGFKNFGRSWGIIGNILLKIWPLLLADFVSQMVLLLGLVILFISSISGNNWLIGFAIILVLIFLIVSIILEIFIIIKCLLYSIANYIAIDRPEISTKEAVEESARLMNGNRGKIFLLGLSFIGWFILCIFTFGIGSLWLMPYIKFSEIVFYEMLKEK